jgi:hypothetical protein
VGRRPHLLATIESLSSQSIASEVLVVEQAASSSLVGSLPAHVRHVVVSAGEELPFSRSWLFNVGARHATGRILVFHDGDLLAPADYARELVRLVNQGFQAARLCRFVFYLDESGTARVLGDGAVLHETPRAVVQNAVGGTVAVTREAYEEIGGHDEAFLGWGGEDNEFFDRLTTLRLYRWGYLPFVHLEHPIQPEARRNVATSSLMERRLATPPGARAERLRSLPWGSVSGPVALEETTC